MGAAQPNSFAHADAWPKNKATLLGIVEKADEQMRGTIDFVKATSERRGIAEDTDEGKRICK